MGLQPIVKRYLKSVHSGDYIKAVYFYDFLRNHANVPSTNLAPLKLLNLSLVYDDEAKLLEIWDSWRKTPTKKPFLSNETLSLFLSRNIAFGHSNFIEELWKAGLLSNINEPTKLRRLADFLSGENLIDCLKKAKTFDKSTLISCLRLCDNLVDFWDAVDYTVKNHSGTISFSFKDLRGVQKIYLDILDQLSSQETLKKFIMLKFVRSVFEQIKLSSLDKATQALFAKLLLLFIAESQVSRSLSLKNVLNLSLKGDLGALVVNTYDSETLSLLLNMCLKLDFGYGASLALYQRLYHRKSFEEENYLLFVKNSSKYMEQHNRARFLALEQVYSYYKQNKEVGLEMLFLIKELGLQDEVSKMAKRGKKTSFLGKNLHILLPNDRHNWNLECAKIIELAFHI